MVWWLFGLSVPQLYDRDDDHWQSLWRCSLAEFFGTLIFVFLGTASVTSAVNSAPRNADGTIAGGDVWDQSSFVMSIAFAHGFAIVISIYSIGEISGGNINPAVSWALMVTRKISVVRFVCFVIAQLLGAILASLVLQSMLPSNIEASDGIGCHGLHDNISSGTGLQFEIVLTFIFIFVVFATAISPFVGKMAPVSGAEYGPGKLTPIVLGLTILVLHLVGVPFTGASMNPARSFGPAVVVGCWENHWVYWIGPIIGSTSAAVIAHIFFLSSPDDVAKVFAGTRGDQRLADVNVHKPGQRVATNDGQDMDLQVVSGNTTTASAGNPYIQHLDED